MNGENKINVKITRITLILQYKILLLFVSLSLNFTITKKSLRDNKLGWSSSESCKFRRSEYIRLNF